MAGNSFGRFFTVTTFGESHGKAIGCIVDGIPPGMELDEMDIQRELDRRKPGTSRYTTARKENDQIQILSGVFEGKTTGTSMGLLIENTDSRSQDYDHLKHQFRPGHADYVYHHKYGIRDHRGGGRSSARETALWVAAGAIAKKYLQQQAGITIYGYLRQMGSLECTCIDREAINRNPFFCADPEQLPKLKEFLKKIKKSGDSIGAKVTVIAENVPIGLGQPVFEKLDASLAHALMSINAVKGVEIGDGFAVIHQHGSQHRDELTRDGFLSNHAGGILGGISTGQPILATVAFKPTSSICIPVRTLTTSCEEVSMFTQGRHDPCVGLRGVPVAEAMMALVLMDHYLLYRAQCDNRGYKIKKDSCLGMAVLE